MKRVWELIISIVKVLIDGDLVVEEINKRTH